ncbi:MAG: hypothetical protein QM644_08720 [Mobilitalea sp.]
MNKSRRIFAILGIVLLLSLILITFLSAFFAKENSNALFMASMFSMIVIPIMLWWFITVYKWVHKKDNSLDQKADNTLTKTESDDEIN